MIIKDSKMGGDGDTEAGTRYITLAPGQSESMVPVAIPGRALAMMNLRHGHKFAIVDADSPAEGVTADLAKSLVDKGICVDATPAAIEGGTSLAAPEEFAAGGVVPDGRAYMVGETQSEPTRLPASLLTGATGGMVGIDQPFVAGQATSEVFVTKAPEPSAVPVEGA